MRCKNCGTEMRNGVCPACGSGGRVQSNRQPDNTLAIVGIVLVLFLPLAGLIVSFIAYSNAKSAGHPTGIAKAGIIVNALFIIIGILASIIAVVVWLFLIIGIGAGAGMM